MYTFKEALELLIKRNLENQKTEKCVYCLDYITKKEAKDNNGKCKYCANMIEQRKEAR